MRQQPEPLQTGSLNRHKRSEMHLNQPEASVSGHTTPAEACPGVPAVPCLCYTSSPSTTRTPESQMKTHNIKHTQAGPVSRARSGNAVGVLSCCSGPLCPPLCPPVSLSVRLCPSVSAPVPLCPSVSLCSSQLLFLLLCPQEAQPDQFLRHQPFFQRTPEHPIRLHRHLIPPDTFTQVDTHPSEQTGGRESIWGVLLNFDPQELSVPAGDVRLDSGKGGETHRFTAVPDGDARRGCPQSSCSSMVVLEANLGLS